MKTISDLASAFLAAHDGGPKIDIVPEALVPADLDTVYAVQDEIVRQSGEAGGWKVAAGIGDPPLCSPIPASRFVAPAAPFDGGHHRIFLAEIEIAVRLGADLAEGASKQAVEAAIAEVLPAIELIGNPFVDRDATPRNLQLADLQSNGAVILGVPLDRAITGALDTLAVDLILDGQSAHSVEKGASWDDILAAIAWLAGHAAARNQPLRAGQVIITGARAVGPLKNATEIEGVLGTWGRVSCKV